jgi:flagellar hook-basal body complex protein FliE
MSVSGIEALGPAGFTPYVAPTVAPTAAPAAAPVGGGQDFGNLVLDGLTKLEGLTDRSDTLAVQAATGNLDNIHDYTIAATETAVATQLTVAVRNKAVEAFNDIMRMQI